MSGRSIVLLALGILLTLAVAASPASGYEPELSPGVEEAEAHPPGLPPPPSEAPSADTIPPETVIDGGSASVSGRSQSFSFVSTEPNSTFVCQFDHREPFGCSSPWHLHHLGVGRHTVSIAAMDAAGNIDPTPASSSFRVRPPSPKRHRLCALVGQCPSTR
jgi:hypothetical protein